VAGAASGSIPLEQLAAWLMACWLNGLTLEETRALALAMRDSGEKFSPARLGKKAVDKHSTGGVGDKTSFLVAPLAAACGVAVPMISGRALGHTGGTLDKLESIPGYRTALSLAEFEAVLEKCGASIVSQTPSLVPADRVLYALRDRTGTVENPGLICASILSKKLAAGLDALVLDVKTGSGAFMKTEEDAAHLAKLLTDTGRRMGKRVVALITDMDQPLGHAVGNAIEVDESLQILRGEGPEDLRQLCRELAAWMFQVAGRTKTLDEARELIDQLIESGAALKRFREMVVLQGGDPEVVDNPTLLPHARHSTSVLSTKAGYVSSIACEDVGTACVILGGGREKKEDAVDPAVGIRLQKKVSDRVAIGEPLCTIFYNNEARGARAKQLLRHSFQVVDAIPEPKKLIRRVIE
jgi:pyrimidine-nucleoside phosphorylase